MKSHGDPEKARGAKAYMRDQFEFFGIPMPVRRKVSKEYLKKGLPPYEELNVIMEGLFNAPQRELHYFGIELLEAMKKQWQPDIIVLMEKMILTKSWWDSVDYMASVWTGPYFKKNPDAIIPVTGKWNKSDNIWLQRSSLLFQLKYKADTNTKLMAEYMVHLSGSKEFFIQKAIGWCLREFSKTDPAWVKKFVAAHTLAPLSKREALKIVNSEL